MALCKGCGTDVHYTARWTHCEAAERARAEEDRLERPVQTEQARFPEVRRASGHAREHYEPDSWNR